MPLESHHVTRWFISTARSSVVGIKINRSGTDWGPRAVSFSWFFLKLKIKLKDNCDIKEPCFNAQTYNPNTTNKMKRRHGIYIIWKIIGFVIGCLLFRLDDDRIPHNSAGIQQLTLWWTVSSVVMKNENLFKVIVLNWQLMMHFKTYLCEKQSEMWMEVFNRHMSNSEILFLILKKKPWILLFTWLT